MCWSRWSSPPTLQGIGHPDSTLQPMACSSSMDMAPGSSSTGCTDSVMVERWDLVGFGSTGGFFVGFLVRLGKISFFWLFAGAFLK